VRLSTWPEGLLTGSRRSLFHLPPGPAGITTMQTLGFASTDPNASLPIRHDSQEALSVSRPLMGKATTAYARNEHLLLGKAPQAVLAGGYVRPADATPRQAFAAAGADFTVVSRSLAFESSPEGADKCIADDHWTRVTERKAIIRTDTMQFLGDVGKGYTPAQQEGLINLFEYLREDATIENILVLDNGRKIFVTAYVDIIGEIVSGHPVRRFLHACNSFDGTTAFSIFFSDMMLRCANQLRFISGKGATAARKGGHGLKLRHTASITEWMENLPQVINLQNQNFIQDLAVLRPLTERPLSFQAAEYILKQTYAKELATPIKDKDSGDLRARTLDDLERQVGTIRSHYAGNTGIDIIPNTVYGLLQAITQYETHDAGRSRDDVKAARTRLESLWGGAGSDRIEAARQACLTVVG
jgi:phage/plasmid-like protein (TIGR03299 family)